MVVALRDFYCKKEDHGRKSIALFMIFFLFSRNTCQFYIYVISCCVFCDCIVNTISIGTFQPDVNSHRDTIITDIGSNFLCTTCCRIIFSCLIFCNCPVLIFLIDIGRNKRKGNRNRNVKGCLCCKRRNGTR